MEVEVVDENLRQKTERSRTVECPEESHDIIFVPTGSPGPPPVDFMYWMKYWGRG